MVVKNEYKGKIMKIAIVIPWYGGQLFGGAERYAGGLAVALKKAGVDVEVLTTCGKDSFWAWGQDYYDEGITEHDGVVVRRFSVRPRNESLYIEKFIKLRNNQLLTLEEQMLLFQETINSDSINGFIQDQGSDYVFIFMPYLYGTTIFGTQLRPEQSFLIPCLHDEKFAYLETIKNMFSQVNGILFISDEEMELAKRLYGLSLESHTVVGGGVQSDVTPQPDRFRAKYNIEHDYLLYIGRKVDGKNVPLLMDYFTRYKQENPSQLKLVLIGKGDQYRNFPSTDILDIGEVMDEQDKFDALGGAIALCQPSLMESFSIVLMESWVCETPVLIHRDCSVTNGHCERSKGGYSFHHYQSFKEQVNSFVYDPVKRKEMGRLGRSYVLQNYTWDKVTGNIIRFIESKGYPLQVKKK